ncbi:MAG TPA: hypothetical protein VN673_06725 [Clostridia bacterium]|nr:hypothetical protein [Clostridia bacterium]
MKRSFTPVLSLLFLAAAALSLATVLQPRVDAWRTGTSSQSVLKVLLGDGRRLFANHFFVQADVSFHSGYYPSIFDAQKAPKDNRHMTAGEADGHEHHAGCNHSVDSDAQEPDHDTHVSESSDEQHVDAHEKAMAFLGEPKDWIERFGRKFIISEHTHLEAGQEREMLPWLRMAAELDPERIQTYTVSAYWLRDMGKIKEAEQFLREGLRHNPGSYEILFELGRLYSDNLHDIDRARNLWELALARWGQHESAKPKPDLLGFNEIALHLAHLEETQTNYTRAIELLTLAKKASPRPEQLDKRIGELQSAQKR